MFLMFLTASTHHLLRLPGGISCRQRGGAPLQVIWRVSTPGAATDRDSVDTVAVAVAGTVVTFLPPVPGSPDKNRAPPMSALRLIGEADRGDSFINDICTLIRRKR